MRCRLSRNRIDALAAIASSASPMTKEEVDRAVSSSRASAHVAPELVRSGMLVSDPSWFGDRSFDSSEPLVALLSSGLVSCSEGRYSATDGGKEALSARRSRRRAPPFRQPLPPSRSEELASARFCRRLDELSRRAEARLRRLFESSGSTPEEAARLASESVEDCIARNL